MTDDYKTDIGNAITHKVGKYALVAGYNGIIEPSARADGGVNIIVFNPDTIQ